MQPSVDKNGYIRFDLIGDNGKRKGMYVHQIVALTYLPNPNNKPYVNHLDHNKANNSVENLQWCTHLENIRHDWSMGRRRALTSEQAAKTNNWARVERIRQLYATGRYTQVEIGKLMGIPQPTVSVIVRNKQWRNEQ